MVNMHAKACILQQFPSINAPRETGVLRFMR